MSLGLYLDSLEVVPPEVQRYLSLIKELDEQIFNYQQKIDSYHNKKPEYVMSEENNLINDFYDKCISLSQDKINISTQLYELVDKLVLRLDKDVNHFELELQKVQKSSNCSSKSKNNNETIKENKETNIASLSMSINEMNFPVDPNEPVYCFCRQVSYGDMIGCDNPLCQYEWFHFGCVNLKSKPKGKWFCSKCISNMK